VSVDAGTVILAAAVIGLGWYLARKGSGGRRAVDPTEYVDHLAPKPLKPSFEADDWNGYSGLQLALCIEMDGDTCYPVIPAGTAPPAEARQTFSTASLEHDELALTVCVGSSDDRNVATLVARVALGPIPASEGDVREVEVVFAVDAGGAVAISAFSEDGRPVRCPVEEQGIQSIPIGPAL